ncbi:MAG: hypothetical protein CVU57_02460 [Deltaproteobacteria bacterium HGW-Deltaproteobacteria-15]|jgi:hypothetical protein|nr:MAG: hypothetical protein CVU57_02460 [Deltaproteobacteria bacterium HGW-Deltaproteobacteria-15]
MALFALEVIEDEDVLPSDRPGRAYITESDYDDFISLALELDRWDDVERSSIVDCDECCSFLTDVYTFLLAVESVLDHLDSADMVSEWQLWSDLYGRLECIKERMYEDYGFVDQWPQEVAIVFDPDCSCNNFFVGKQEPAVDSEDDDFVREPSHELVKERGDKVSIYVEPRKLG